jgi:acyl-CoA synthetase (AMP-forming)/AMP-acid ligase II
MKITTHREATMASASEIRRDLASADIAEAVVVGLPHDRWTEAITALVVARAGADLPEQELLVAVRAYLDPYKVPKAVITVAELPRTSAGKIQKNVLREQYAHYYDGQP